MACRPAEVSLKSRLAPLAHRVERWVDRRLPGSGNRDAPLVDPYTGYETPDGVILRGRVLSSLRRGTPRADHSAWVNFRQMAALFLTDEVAKVRVACGAVETLSDEEGYFTLTVPVPSGDPPAAMEVVLPATGETALVPVFLRQPGAEFGVISDIDDTMMRTGAYSLARNLWTSLTGNALTRHVFPDAVALMTALAEGGRNPVFYVSSSPWNLHDFLATIFQRAGLPMGPMFLRDLGISETQFVTGTHGDHKGGAIDRILAANPDLRFVLIGDTGQHDAHVYRDAIRRHEGRIVRVILRQPGPGPDAESRAAMEEIRALGITLDTAPDYKALKELARHGSGGA